MLGELQLSAALFLSDNYQSLHTNPSLNAPGVSSELVICMCVFVYVCMEYVFVYVCMETDCARQKLTICEAVISCEYE